MAELMVGSRVDGIKPTLEIAWMLHPPTSNNQETVSKKKTTGMRLRGLSEITVEPGIYQVLSLLHVISPRI